MTSVLSFLQNYESADNFCTEASAELFLSTDIPFKFKFVTETKKENGIATVFYFEDTKETIEFNFEYDGDSFQGVKLISIAKL